MKEIDYIDGIVLNIYETNNDQALIKILTKDQILFLVAKGFFKNNSKHKANIKIASLTNFEVFNSYGTENKKLLKKATLLLEFDLINEANFSTFQQIAKLFQLVEEPNQSFFETYSKFLREKSYIKSNHLLTFLLNKILETKGLKLNTSKCVVCQSTQKLYSFSSLDGGMFCYQHKFKQGIKNLTILKGIYQLGKSFETYKNIDDQSNQIIYKELLKLIYH